eukprot:Hpha_TRINITY_DN2970_c0_g1::TRINITY_DN2970_c0_g1_i1::g.19646::m.19646/K00036/G6PD, zwf; glucose-6-phosphate 1-dehydrogenase
MEASLSEEAEAYLRDKRVHFLFNELAAELIDKKPVDPLAHLAAFVPQLQRVQLPPRGQQDDCVPAGLRGKALTIVVIGASGDLSRKKVFPALYQLFAQGRLPPNTSFVGYGRSDWNRRELERTVGPYLSKTWHDTVAQRFFAQCSFVRGRYNDPSLRSFKGLDHDITALEADRGGPAANRLFYLAIPPDLVPLASRGVREAASSPSGWTRVLVEKPFGRDTLSAADLATEMTGLFDEGQMFRVDRFLSREAAESVLSTRFSNRLLSQGWDRNSVASVHLSFRLKEGLQGHARRFDRQGIIRDVVQPHLLELMALMAMEKPRSLSAEDVRDERAALLKRVALATTERTVVGQYSSSIDGRYPAYKDESGVPQGSRCATYVCTVLNVNNDRWDGVPWVLEAGYGLHENDVAARVRFRSELVPFGAAHSGYNELTFRFQPEFESQLRLNAREQGSRGLVLGKELDLMGGSRYYSPAEPDAFEDLVLSALKGESMCFARTDEVKCAWEILTPLLEELETADPHDYIYGTKGPPEGIKLRLTHHPEPPGAPSTTPFGIAAQK